MSKKFLQPGIQTVITSNKIKFKPYSDFFQGNFSSYTANVLGNEDPFCQIENDQDDENTEPNSNYAIPNLMPRNVENTKILECINSLNSKRRCAFNVVHNWYK